METNIYRFRIYKTPSQDSSGSIVAPPPPQKPEGLPEGGWCFLNNPTIESIIKARRQKRLPYHVLSLDLRKAFDTVSHHSLERALRRFRVGGVVRNYILESYWESFTKIITSGGETGEIPFLRGVRQGDPLSPVLFNLILD